MRASIRFHTAHDPVCARIPCITSASLVQEGTKGGGRGGKDAEREEWVGNRLESSQPVLA